MVMLKQNRIVNIHYKVDGLSFDAAIDCDWQLHAYTLDCFPDKSPKITPVELYCFDYPEWDIHMLYMTAKDIGFKNPETDINFQQREDSNLRYDILLHTFVNFDLIIEETHKWIKENETDIDLATEEVA